MRPAECEPFGRLHSQDQRAIARETMATVLVVDDSRAIRTILSKTLRELGFEVREAANGQEALQVIQAEKSAVKLILLDSNMPEMDGLELLKRLRKNPEFSSLVIVMVSAETEMDHIAEALEAGANEYVMKPFTKDIIIGKLQLAGIQTCGA
jgi:two-component system chemotaxis response regulator CheY